MSEQLHEVRFRIELSVRYHERLERWYDWWDRLAKAIAVVGGAATVSTLIGSDAAGLEMKTWIAAAITASSAISLVFGFPEKARRHHDLKRRYCAVEAEILEAGEPDEAALRKFDARLAMLEADSPGRLSTLAQLCHNEIVQARGQWFARHPVPFWKLPFVYLLDMPAAPKEVPATPPR